MTKTEIFAIIKEANKLVDAMQGFPPIAKNMVISMKV